VIAAMAKNSAKHIGRQHGIRCSSHHESVISRRRNNARHSGTSVSDEQLKAAAGGIKIGARAAWRAVMRVSKRQNALAR